MHNVFQNRFSKALKLAAVAAGSWRFWCLTAAAATSVVLFKEIWGSSEDAPGANVYYDLQAAPTDPAERLMTFNRIKTSMKGQVDYDNFNGSTTGAKANRNWWEFLNDEAVLLDDYNLQNGTHFLSHAKGEDGPVLWEFINCRGGNLNPTSTGGKPKPYQNLLPWSSETYSFKSRISTANLTTAGTLVMQNTPDAQVISSCLKDGIGTVYFDAVNGFNEYDKGQLAVEVAYGVWATNADGAVSSVVKDKVAAGTIFDDPNWRDYLAHDADGNLLPPDDANVHEYQTVNPAPDLVVNTNDYGRVAWIRANLTGRWWCNGETGTVPTNAVFNPRMPEPAAKVKTTGTYDNFYRVWAPVQDADLNPALAPYCRGPMRFRIKRLDDPDKAFTSPMGLEGEKFTDPSWMPRNGLLILDNIIASFPAMKAWAIPAGEYVNGGSARNVIGWTGVVSTNYPAVGMAGLRATAGFEVATNAPPGVTADWIPEVESVLSWRWRYMDQAIGDWQELPLGVQPDGSLASATPFDLPLATGDIELRYETKLDAPYYGYVDYSGKGVGTPGYSERIRVVSSRLNPEACGSGGIPAKLPSRGTDFFFRLRSGASEQLEYVAEVCRADATDVILSVPCWLTDDRTWKTYLKTTTNQVDEITSALPRGKYRFRIRGVKPALFFGGEEPVAEIPWSARRLSRADDPSLAWTPFTVDSATDALMFQIIEDPAVANQMTYTIVHASFQDFNAWTDAAGDRDADYVGAFFEGRGKQSGSSPDAQQFPCELDTWNPLSAFNAQYWTEGFTVASNATPLAGYDGHPAYEPFAHSWTPNGWESINSMWVCSKWRQAGTGGDMALQLGSFGDGYLEYVNTAEVPHGINQVNFKARLAQAPDFGDFAIYDAGTSSDQKDYLFSVRAVMFMNDSGKSEFDGNGTVSVIGYYRAEKGCYEMRAERIDTDTVRMNLYKWTKVSRTKAVATLLGYHRSTLKLTSNSYLRMSASSIPTSEAASGAYGELFMRCTTAPDGSVTIVAGLLNGSKKLSDKCSGVSHYYLTYIDRNDPITYGRFGFDSLNCPAQIVDAKKFPKGTDWRDGVKTPDFPEVTSKPKDKDGKDITNADFKCGNATLTYTGDGDSLFLTAVEAGQTIYQNWAIRGGKYAIKTDFAQRHRGLTAAEPSGTVALSYTAGGKETSVTNMTVSGFRFNDLTATVRNTADSLVKLSTGVDSEDVVVDNVSFDQWSAGSYDDPDNTDFEDKLPSFGAPTNFVYVNGWVRTDGDRHFIDLQPVRAISGSSPGDLPVSIRSPLMDGRDGRGKGLGLLSYTYKDADPHCRVIVQYRDDIEGTEYLASRTRMTDGWTDVATNDFSTGEYDLKGGTITTYVGVHGGQGAMRLVIDPGVVRDAQTATKNPGRDPAYGRITITDFRATDEPALDGMCWWGWNLRTSEDPSERSLVDSVDGAPGLALALNNSVSDRTVPDPGESEEDCRKRYAQNLPFVQTPTFYTNLINEVSFQARRMTEADPVTEVAILGAKDGGVSEQTEWKWLKTIAVESVSYETYSYKARANDGYRSFRIAVIGVKDVDPNHADKMDGRVPKNPPPRILIDEVSVSEGVYGKVRLFDVGAFRTPLERHEYVTNLFDITQQPMCEEAWSVQCEVRAVQLADEIRLDDDTVVLLHWYKGEKWGYSKWADDPAAKSAPLARIPEQAGFVYRGSYPAANGAIVEPSFKSGDVVQFMLEVRYKNADGTDADPYFMPAGDWNKPAWYRGIDYNAERGGFAAYTILDTVAYGYAWINEVNVYDGPSSSSNRARTNQWIEVALPAEASIDRWKLQFITGGVGDGNPFFTNTVVTYRDLAAETPGYVPPRKPKNKHMDVDSGYVFLTAASPATMKENPALKENFYVDGSWAVSEDDFNPDQEQLKADGTLSGGYPFGVRLVRPSGIIEDEVVVIGTNIYARLGEWEAAQHSPTNFVNRLRKVEGDDRCYFTGEDDGSNPLFARSQTNQFATSEADWAYWPQTPGRINANGSVKQRIASDHPQPYATMVIVYANLEGGHITQSYGEYTNVADNLVLYVPKGLTNGTNIVYHVDDWYELGSFTETEAGVEKQRVGPFLRQRRVEIPIAKNASNDVMVVAATQLRQDLENEFGLGLDNPYRSAVVAWLERNATMRGAFKHKGDEIQEIALARLEGLDGVDRGEMSLTDMYWFDMDPTWEGQVFRMGMIEAPLEKPVGGRVPYEDDDGSGGKVTNLVMQVFMKIYNPGDPTFEPYAPYTLNGRKPGSSSAVDSSGWDSETFKITGIVNNGTDETIPETAKWLPLRYFVFGPDSFKDFRSTIEIIDPFSPLSPAYYQGWDKLKGKPTFFSFSIDTRTAPVSPEILNWDSTFE